jgi:DNA-binding Lrp family transcriptional regulator
MGLTGEAGVDRAARPVALELDLFKSPFRPSKQSMDLRDFQILVELNRRPFASNETIGRAVGITGAAVKARLDRMKKHRVFEGFQAVPSPQVLGKHWHIWTYQGVDTGLDVGDLLEIENVVSVWRGGQGEVFLNTFDPTYDARPPKGVEKFLGNRPAQVISVHPPGGPSAVDDILSPLDWRVMDALISNCQGSLSELAEATGLSARTVRKRRDHLLSRGQISLPPRLDTTREAGLIVYSGYVSAKFPKSLDQIDAPGLMVVRRLHDPPVALFMGYAETLAEVQSTELRLRGVPGVMEVDLRPSRHPAFATRRLHGWVRAEIKRWETARRAPRTN